MKIFDFILFALFAVISSQIFADEIPNTREAVKNAKPGDYIVLIDGSHYIITEAEIDIVKGQFDYYDDTELKDGIPRPDGGMEYTITLAHKRIIWPDGKTMDIFKSRRAFDTYMDSLRESYYPIPRLSILNNELIGYYFDISSPEDLNTFRAKVYKTFLTSGREISLYIEAQEFNRDAIGEGLKSGFQASDDGIVYGGTGGTPLEEVGTKRDE
jgi:hypothetical protein